MTGKRIESIDVLRGVTILVMLFVNDIAGVKGTPSWMRHMPSHTDGMTFVDVVFPAFLFIVGMSIPFAIGKRLSREPRHGALPGVVTHILIRTLGLLVIGFFMVNSSSISAGGILNPHLWTLLMYTAVILVWNTPPRGPGRKRTLMLGMRAAGILLLVVLAFLYKGNGEPGLMEMRPMWWGILGLIGWAYLTACITYIFLHRRVMGLLGVMVLLYLVYMANAVGFFSIPAWIKSWIDIGSMLGSHSAIVVAGVILGKMLQPGSPLETHRARIRWALLYGLWLALAGILLHSLNQLHIMFIFSKNLATPPWCLLCSAITAWVWAAVYWVTDVRGWKDRTGIIEPAGSNALFVYILAPVFYALIALLPRVTGGYDFYAHLGAGFATGFWRSLILAFAMAWLAGRLRRLGIRLKL